MKAPILSGIDGGANADQPGGQPSRSKRRTAADRPRGWRRGRRVVRRLVLAAVQSGPSPETRCAVPDRHRVNRRQSLCKERKNPDIRKTFRVSACYAAPPMFERSRAPRLPPALAVAALVLVLGLLATLQYRWVGQVGEAERARLQEAARTRVGQLAQDFDREVTRAFAWLQVDADMLGPDGGARYPARHDPSAAPTHHAR